MSIRGRGEISSLPEYRTLRRSANVLPNPAGPRCNKYPQDEQDQDHSLRGRTNIHHNKSYIRRKNQNIRNNKTARVLVLEEGSHVPRHGVIVGMVPVNKRKQCDLRAFVAFSGSELILLGVGPVKVV